MVSNECAYRRLLRRVELQTRGPYGRRSVPHFRLHELDQLHELGHGVQPEERQEPLIERASLLEASFASPRKELYRLLGEGIHEAGDPTDSTHGDALEDHVVHAGEDRDPV